MARAVLVKGAGLDASTAERPPVCARHAGAVMNDLGLTRVDLIKIDCEGAELDVLTALPAEMLQQCQWIVGEMHDVSAFNLLALLAPHFDLDLKKIENKVVGIPGSGISPEQRKRLNLAVELASNPQLIFLDEVSY